MVARKSSAVSGPPPCTPISRRQTGTSRAMQRTPGPAGRALHVDRLNGAAKVDAAGDGKPALQRLAEQSRRQRDQHADAEIGPTPCRVERPELDRVFMLARVTVADQLSRTRV